MKKKVFITGANGSLGLALTKKFNDENYDLFLNLRKVDHNIKKFIKFRNSKIEIVKGDLTKNKTLKIISEKIKKNNVELLINNAGLYLNKEFDKIKYKEIEEVFNLNFFSNLFLFKEILQKKVKKLTIVNINSIAGYQGSANETIYSASKHAMKGFYESLEKEPKLNKFNFINFYPGAFQSKITKHRIDYNKLIQPSELAETIYNSVINYDSLKINNIFIKRKIY